MPETCDDFFCAFFNWYCTTVLSSAALCMPSLDGPDEGFDLRTMFTSYEPACAMLDVRLEPLLEGFELLRMALGLNVRRPLPTYLSCSS